MKTHDLKTDPDVFEAVYSGLKTFEIRKDDRGFEIGDLLRLLETESSAEAMAEGARLEFTGRQSHHRVRYIMRGYGLAQGWCIMAI